MSKDKFVSCEEARRLINTGCCEMYSDELLRFIGQAERWEDACVKAHNLAEENQPPLAIMMVLRKALGES